jgi:hypothetical protein
MTVVSSVWMSVSTGIPDTSLTSPHTGKRSSRRSMGHVPDTILTSNLDFRDAPASNERGPTRVG